MLRTRKETSRGVSEPLSRRFECACEGGAVYFDDAELRSISVGPLKVVEKRPLEITTYIKTILEQPPNPFQGFVEVANALLIVGRTNSVLGHDDWYFRQLRRPSHRVLDAVGPKEVTHIRDFALGIGDDSLGAENQFGVTLHADVVIVAEREEVLVFHLSSK